MAILCCMGLHLVSKRSGEGPVSAKSMHRSRSDDGAWRSAVSPGAASAHDMLGERYVKPARDRRNGQVLLTAGHAGGLVAVSRLARKPLGRLPVVLRVGTGIGLGATMYPTLRGLRDKQEAMRRSEANQRRIRARGYERMSGGG